MASSGSTSQAQPRPRNRWRGPLVAGFCFGLGYGITQRLLALQLPGLVQLRQGFEVREFPGTSLESLRLRFGTDTEEIRGDLEVLELERQAAKRDNERKQEERKQAEAERARLAEEQAEEARRQREAEDLQPPAAAGGEPPPEPLGESGQAVVSPAPPSLPPPTP